MKNILLFALASISLFASCTQEESTNAPVDNSQVKVQLGTKAPVITTKATIVEGTNWENLNVGIYAAPKTVAITGTNCFIANEKGTIKESGITFVSDIFYPAISDIAYNFYGYHPYGVPTFADNSYAVEYTLNGTQDILWGKAETTEEQETNVGTAGFTAKYIRLLGKYNKDNPGTIIAGPSISFGHKLARFAFSVKDGNDAETTTSVQTIKSVQLLDIETKATLTIAGGQSGTLTAGSVKGDFDLKDNKGENIAAYAIQKGEYQSLGDGIMFFPDTRTEHKAKITFSDAATGKDYVSELPIQTSDKSVFEAGKSYNIKLIVYGPGMVKIEAVLAPWTEIDTPEHEIN